MFAADSRFRQYALPALLLLPLVGCSHAQPIVRSPHLSGTAASAETAPRFMLASYQPQQPAPQPGVADSSQTDQGDDATTQPARLASYTAPRPEFQQLELTVPGLNLSLTPGTVGAGKEISESVSFGSQGALGRARLTAPSPTVAGAALSRGRLVRGSQTGLGAASATHNIFTARVNRLSGPAGRCNDLTRAGFFANRAMCEQHFSRR